MPTAADRADELSLSTEQRIDAVCRRFEADWKSGRRPNVAEYMVGCPNESERAALLRELILLDTGYRRRVGESPGVAASAPLRPDGPAELTTAAHASAPEPPAVVPSVVFAGRYRLVERIGEGGMGTVYRCEDAPLARAVAVKVLHDKHPTDSPTGRRFLDEARITAGLQHPGIPAVHEVGTLPDGRPFLAMKLIGGRTLDAALPDYATADPARWLPEFESLCQAVGYAHAHGVIHRDLKPANVMFGEFGEVQVMDWGLARRRRGDERAARDEETQTGAETDHGADPVAGLTRPGTVLGTPAYMSPEQAAGETDRIDERADVFGLGGILCALLTGRPPFVAETSESTRQLAVQKRLQPAYQRLEASGADADLVALCKRCLAGERDDRPRDAGAVAAAVADLRAERAERMRRAELAEVRLHEERQRAELRAAEARRRQRLRAALGGAVALLLTGGLGFAWYAEWQAGQRQLAEAAAEVERTRLAGERDAEARLKAGQANRGIDANLRLAADLRRQLRFTPAAAALAQAADLTVAVPERAAEVAPARQELAFVTALDDLRYRRWVWVATPDAGPKYAFDTRELTPGFGKLFAANGPDVVRMTVTAAADAVARSAIRPELIAALDDWAIHEPDARLRDKLLDILRRSDPHPWANRFRDAAVWTDPAALSRLAAEAGTAAADPARVAVLAEVMDRQGLDPVPLLEAARANHPTDFHLAFALGRWFTAHGPTGREIGPYEAARALRPDSFATWTNLGNAFLARGDLDAALAAHNTAMTLAPAFAPAVSNRGNVYLQRGGEGDLARAKADYERAVTLDPEFALGHYNLGHTRLKANELATAVAAFRRAIALDPKYPPAHLGLGAAYLRQGKPNEAIEALRAAVALDDRQAAARISLAKLLAARNGNGDAADAIRAYREAAALDPRNTAVRYELGLLRAARKEWPAATAAFREAVAIDPRHAAAWFHLGLVLKDTNDPNGAIAAFRQAVAADVGTATGRAAVQYNLGVVLMRQKDSDGAFAAYSAAVRLDPTHARAQTNLGTLHAERNDHRAAAACARAAVAADPSLANAHALLGLSLVRQDDLVGARASLDRACELDPKFAATRARVPPPPIAPSPRPTK